MANMALARWSRQWMVREAHSESNLSKPTQAVNINVNTKGKLLELGGKVVAERVWGRMPLWSCTRAVAEWSSWQQPSYPPLCWRDDGHATNYSMPEGGTMSRHVTSLWWIELGDNLVELHPPSLSPSSSCSHASHRRCRSSARESGSTSSPHAYALLIDTQHTVRSVN